MLLQLLAWAMWIKMKDVEGMLLMVGLPLSQHHQHHLAMLADFYYQIMVFGKGRDTERRKMLKVRSSEPAFLL